MLWLSGGRDVHQDELLPLLPLTLPRPLREPLWEGAPAEGEGAGGGQDQRQSGPPGQTSAAARMINHFETFWRCLWFFWQELTVVCPVCREPLTYDVTQLLSSPAPQLPEVKLVLNSPVNGCLSDVASKRYRTSCFSCQLDEAAIGSDFQQKWRELQKLLESQRSRGGIIDPEVESNRFLIHINEVRMCVRHSVPVCSGLRGRLRV